MVEVTVSKWGNSLALRLPKEILNQQHVKEGDVLSVESEGAVIMLKKSRKITRYHLSDVLDGFKSGSACPAYDWGDPFGREL